MTIKNAKVWCSSPINRTNKPDLKLAPKTILQLSLNERERVSMRVKESRERDRNSKRYRVKMRKREKEIVRDIE